MARVFQTFDKDGKPHPVWRFQFTDFNGRRRTQSGTASKKKTEELAAALQWKHRQMRLGNLPKPKTTEGPREIGPVIEEYLAWGAAQGGRGGRGWASTHTANRRRLLNWWVAKLRLKITTDLEGCQARVESGLRDAATWKKKKAKETSQRTPATLQRYADGIRSFCRWAFQRGFLEDDPLKRLQSMPRVASFKRRALTVEEVRQLVTSCAPHRRRCYELALCTGLRANELRSLIVADLDAERCELNLHADWTKDRRASAHPLPPSLAAQLAQETAGKDPTAPLLYVPGHGHESRELRADLKAAAVPVWAPGGKVDFHALRVTYVTLCDQAGATGKEMQDLARHKDPYLTMNIYARSRRTRLADVADAVGDLVGVQDCIIGEQKKVSGSATSITTKTCADLAGVHGNRTHPTPLRTSLRL